MSVVHLVTLLCISLYHAGFVSAWDADAGITTSWTKVDNVTVTSTSGTNSAFANDGNDNTNWVSASCLPTYYFNRDDVNVLKNSCANMKCFLNSVSCSNCQDSSDGSVYTTLNISPITINGDTKANFSIKLTPPIKLEVISFSGRFSDNTTSIFVKYDSSVDKPGDMLKSFLTTDSYKTFQLTPSDPTALISEIEITSSSSFGVKEIAAIGENGCTEKITVDLGTFREVGIIRTRHWAGTNAAMSLALLTSSDGISWNNVSMLDPEALRPVMTTIPPRLVRFISLTYRVNLKNYQKVYCYEIDAWDRNGIWGPKIPVRAQPYSLRDILGVNGIWGWGHNSYSDSSIQGKGPTLYNAIASHARNYHNLNWDVTDPDNDPEFPAMAAGNGTQAKWWLNWDTEYTAWANSNLKVDASIQFLSKTFPPQVWNNPEAAAFHYGQEFAKHFGSAVGNGLIEAIEIGNEPWDYEASFYSMILKGMSDGVRSVDSSIHVLPGAFQAESKFESHNYIGTRVLPNVADNLSAINCHTYSYLVDPMGIRRGVHPENRLSTFNSIRPISHWRDVNMPGKPVWVTEWGWDSDGQGETCTFPECVTEQAQAVYGVRGLAILSRSGIARATWYFYASLDHDSLYGRSGLTSSLAKNFTKKTVFKVFEELLNQMGNTHFLYVVQEDNDGYIYLYSDQHNQKSSQGSFGSLNLASHILAWLPLDIADTRTHVAEINLPGSTRVVQGWRFVAHSSVNHTEHISLGQLVVNEHTLLLPLSTYPVLVELAQTHTVIPVGKR